MASGAKKLKAAQLRQKKREGIVVAMTPPVKRKVEFLLKPLDRLVQPEVRTLGSKTTLPISLLESVNFPSRIRGETIRPASAIRFGFKTARILALTCGLAMPRSGADSLFL